MRILYIEPYDAGSHAQFGRTLVRGIAAEWTVLTLPGRHSVRRPLGWRGL